MTDLTVLEWMWVVIFGIIAVLVVLALGAVALSLMFPPDDEG